MAFSPIQAISARMSLRGLFGSYDHAVFGAILIAVMLFAPAGVLGLDVRAGVRAAVLRLRPRGAPEPAGPEHADEVDRLPVHRLDADAPKGGP